MSTAVCVCVQVNPENLQPGCKSNAETGAYHVHWSLKVELLLLLQISV